MLLQVVYDALLVMLVPLLLAEFELAAELLSIHVYSNLVQGFNIRVVQEVLLVTFNQRDLLDEELHTLLLAHFEDLLHL